MQRPWGSLLPVLFVCLLACTPAAPPDDALAVHEARITELEAQVRALQARLDADEAGTDAPLGDLPDEAWVAVGEVAWATNGHVLIRRDGPRPDPAAVRPRWRRGMTAEEFAGLLVVPSPSTALTRVDTLEVDGTPVVRFGHDDVLVHLDAAYAPLLEGTVVQGADPLGPVYALAADGTAIAVVMPRVPPTGR